MIGRHVEILSRLRNATSFVHLSVVSAAVQSPSSSPPPLSFEGGLSGDRNFSTIFTSLYFFAAGSFFRGHSGKEGAHFSKSLLCSWTCFAQLSHHGLIVQNMSHGRIVGEHRGCFLPLCYGMCVCPPLLSQIEIAHAEEACLNLPPFSLSERVNVSEEQMFDATLENLAPSRSSEEAQDWRRRRIPRQPLASEAGTRVKAGGEERDDL